MRTHPYWSQYQGFTLIELMVTLALLAVLGTLVVPLAQVQMQRQKEQDLRRALWEIRDAIDSYKLAADTGRIKQRAGATGYPASLDLLVEGVEDLSDPAHRKIFFLRRVPRDPFADDMQLSNSATWAKRAYVSEAEDPREGDDVYDVYSKSSTIGLNNIPLSDW